MWKKAGDAWNRVANKFKLRDQHTGPTIDESIARADNMESINEDKGYNPYDSGSFRAVNQQKK